MKFKIAKQVIAIIAIKFALGNLVSATGVSEKISCIGLPLVNECCEAKNGR